MFDRYRPQSFPRGNDMLLRRPSSTGRGAGVKSAEYRCREEHGSHPPAPVNIVTFLHPAMIRNAPRFPNGFLSKRSTAPAQRRGGGHTIPVAVMGYITGMLNEEPEVERHLAD